MKKGGRPKRKMRRGGRTRRKKNAGGYLHGPSHEHGGIAANVGGNTPIELEGGEYIVNAETVSAVGTEFLDQLNSTQTSYHTGGFQQGQLPSPSQYKRGGKVRRTKMKRGGRHVARRAMRKGGRPRRKMRYGGVSPTGVNTRPSGTSCPPGMHMMPDGTCMKGAYHGAPTSMQAGGSVSSCPHGNIMVDQFGRNYCG